MGLLDSLIAEVNKSRPADEQITRLNTGSRVIETTAQAKYNDVRKVEADYTHGVNRSRKIKSCHTCEHLDGYTKLDKVPICGLSSDSVCETYENL